MKRPPRLPRLLLGWLVPRGRIRDGLLGDLDELYAERIRKGRVSGDLWYVRQLLSAAVRFSSAQLAVTAYLFDRISTPAMNVLDGRPGRERMGRLPNVQWTIGAASRSLRRAPGFACSAALRLGLGIGAVTAMFTVVDHGPGRAFRPTLIGLVVGSIGALAAGRVLQRRLFRVDPGDPAMLTAAAGMLLLTALAASWIPARRAGSIDPAETLRRE